VIMAGQVAIASVLLVGALLLVRSFLGLMHADLGYDAATVLTARVVLGDGEYSPQRRLEVLTRILERLNATPGVNTTAFANGIPFTSGEALSSFPVKKRDGSSVQVQTGARQVSPGYFAALGQRVVEGRGFTEEDTQSPAAPVIVNREFSRKYLEGRALGWFLPGDTAAKKLAQTVSERLIIGVVEDTARHDVTDTPQPEVYSVISRADGRSFAAAHSCERSAPRGPRRRRSAPPGPLVPRDRPGGRAVRAARIDHDDAGPRGRQFVEAAPVCGAARNVRRIRTRHRRRRVVRRAVVHRRAAGTRNRRAHRARRADARHHRLVVGQSMAIAGAGLAAG